MKELFLVCAMALPSAVPYQAKQRWIFGPEEVKVIRMLRDYANGETASRSHKWTLIYGRHPLWVHMIREAGVKVVGMYRQQLSWPYYVTASPLRTPFRQRTFQVYIYDDFPALPYPDFIKEVSRIVSKHGFFLYRYTKNGDLVKYLEAYNWQRFEWDFHEFTIWWRPMFYDFTDEELFDQNLQRIKKQMLANYKTPYEKFLEEINEIIKKEKDDQKKNRLDLLLLDFAGRKIDKLKEKVHKILNKPKEKKNDKKNELVRTSA